MDQDTQDWLKFLGEAGAPIRLHTSIADSFAKSCLTLKMAIERYNESSLRERDEELDKLLDGPLSLVLESNPVGKNNIKQAIILKIKAKSSKSDGQFETPVPTSSRSRLVNLDTLSPERYRTVMAAINKEFTLKDRELAPAKVKHLTELVNVLYDSTHRKTRQLPNKEVVFIIPPHKLEVPSVSVVQFFGIMIRPAYVQLGQVILSDTHSVCIKGTPGIGKSMFALYMIYLFITDESTQAETSMWKNWRDLVYDNGLPYVFHFKRGCKEFASEDRRNFSDTGDYNSSNLIQLADGFAYESNTHYLNARLIYISSSNLFSQSKINKNLIVKSYYMPVWTFQEIELCNDALRLVQDTETVRQLYDHFGVCPRYVLYYAKHQDSTLLLRELDDRISNNDPQSVIDYIVDHKFIEDVSSSLIHYTVSSDFQTITYTFASDYIQSRVISILERGHKRKLVHAPKCL